MSTTPLFSNHSVWALIKTTKKKKKRDILVYLLAKQHMRPVLPKNHKNPKKRTSDKTAVAYSRNLKKFAVRTDADC